MLAHTDPKGEKQIQNETLIDQPAIQPNPICCKHGETYKLLIAPPHYGWVYSVDYTIGTTKLGNLKSDELDQHLKQMKTGDGEYLKLTARLTNDYATHWSWNGYDGATKDQQFELWVSVITKK